jgi:hypothetical protein
LIAALNPALIGHANYIWDTSFFALAVAISVWISVSLKDKPFQLRSFLSFGVWLGLVALLNPALTLTYPLLILFPLWHRAALSRRELFTGIGVSLLGWMLAIAPWRTLLFIDPLPYIDKDRDLTVRALAARQLTNAGASVAATGVGTIGYYSERRIVDLLGKCDRRVARLPMRRATRQNPLTYFLPGHLKWDYAYSIGELKPDLVAQLWEYPAEAQPYLRDYVVTTTMVGGEPLQMAARKGSTAVVRP